MVLRSERGDGISLVDLGRGLVHRESSELKDGRVLGVFRGAALRVTDVPGAEQGRGLEGDDVTDAAVNPAT